jgi:hypothetical protein
MHSIEFICDSKSCNICGFANGSLFSWNWLFLLWQICFSIVQFCLCKCGSEYFIVFWVRTLSILFQRLSK